MTAVSDMVNVQNGPENVNTGNHREWLQRDACEPKFQHISDAEIISTVTEQRDEEENVRMSKDQGNRDHIRCNMSLARKQGVRGHLNKPLQLAARKMNSVRDFQGRHKNKHYRVFVKIKVTYINLVNKKNIYKPSR